MSDPILERLRIALADRYADLRAVGEGGMAKVFLARDVKHDRDVALKVLHPEVAAAVGPERFLHEIRVTAGLLHPNILPLYDSGDADGLIYYVMPYVSGETLGERLEREGPLSVGEALRITREIAGALDHAHAAGVVHRDVKPDNILMAAGRTFVCDFGIARVADEAVNAKLTSTGISVGTPLYMSPEQASGGGDVSARSDVYSLACVLYQMLAGEPPYTGPTARMVTIKRLTDPVPSVRRLRESVPPEVDAALTKALQKLPVDRFASAGAFAAALGTGEAGPATHAVGPDDLDGVASSTEADPMGSFPNVPVRSAFVAIALGALLLTALLMQRRPEIPELGEAAFTQVTREPGAETFPALSPTGDVVVFAKRGDLVLRSLTEGTERRLTSDPASGNTQPTFSPDGTRVAFRSERNGGGLFVLGIESGDVRRLTNFGYNPAWSPDGQHVLFATEGVTDPSTRRSLSNLFLVDVETGDQQRVSDIDAVQPSWSPDGSRIAFWSVMRDGALTSQRDIWTMAADGSDAVAVTDDRAVDWNPVWSADGTHLIFSSDRGGGRNLWSVAIDPATGVALADPRPLTSGGTGSHEQVVVAAGGGHALYVERLTRSNLHRLPLDPETGAITGAPEPVTTGSQMAIEPSVSPDGAWVAFYTLEEPMALHVAATDGSRVQRLTDDGGNDRSPQWSPDGGHIAFHSDRSGRYQIWAAEVGGTPATPDPEMRQLTASGVITIYSFWSPNSRRVGFVEIGRGVAAVTVDEPSAGVEMLIPGDLMVRPAWSPDGDRIAGVLPPAAGGTGIVVYSLESRALETVSDFGDAPQWLPDGRRLVFAWGSRLYLADTETDEVRELYALEDDVLGLGSVSSDGRWIYFSRTVTEADLWRIDWSP
ncbi:MAG: protein kinase [Gemmatimonadota bacterium]